MIQGRVILTSNALDDKSAALSFAPQPCGGHAAIREGNLRCYLKTKRGVVVFKHKPTSARLVGPRCLLTQVSVVGSCRNMVCVGEKSTPVIYPVFLSKLTAMRAER